MRNTTETITLVFVALTIALLSGCMKRSRLLTGGSLPVQNGSNPFQPDFKQDVYDLGSALDDLSPAENQGLSNALKGMDSVNAEFEEPIPKHIADKITDLLGPSSSGSPESLQMKMALIGQLMEYCANAALALAPRPGEPLLGQWDADCDVTTTVKKVEKTPGLLDQVFSLVRDVLFGPQAKKDPEPKKSTANYSFHVSGEYEGELSHHRGATVMETKNAGFSTPLPTGGALFRVSGRELSSSLAISPSGIGTVVKSQADWRGELRDSPYAGEGALMQMKNISNGTELKQCSAHLVQSENPIPRKFVEAVKKMGGCLRPAAILFSPALDKMFADMDPGMRMLLLQSMLGIRQ